MTPEPIPCGPVPGGFDDECACGCTAYEEICDYHAANPQEDPHRPIKDRKIEVMTLENHAQGLINVDADGTATVRRSPILTLMANEVEACNRAKGWYEVNPAIEEFEQWYADEYADEFPPRVMEKLVQLFGDRTVGDDLALLTSEVSEALEAYREHGLADQTKHSTDGVLMKPEGFGSEAADILVRLLDLCNRRGIDLFEEWRRKMDFNWTRPQRHGGKLL